MALFGPPDIKKLKATGNVKGLVKALGYKKDSGVRITAAQALGDIGDTRAVEQLMAALGDEKTRATAGRILPSMVEPLIAALGDGNGDVRAAAARALENLGWKQ